MGSNEPIETNLQAWVGRLQSGAVRTYLGPVVAKEVLQSLKTYRPAAPPTTIETELNRDLFPRDEFVSP